MTQNPYQSPETDEGPTRSVPEVDGHPLAGRRARLESAVIDWFAAQFLAAPLAFSPVFPLFGLPLAEQPDAFSSWMLWAIFALWCLSSLATYCALNYRSLERSSQTLGMRWKRLKFVSRDGSPVTVGQILIRRTALLWPLYFVPGFNALFAFYSLGLALRESRYSLHDDIAATAVVLAD
ncbi:RDD family protein [Posidoniimonas polymericola]|uniref:RDD family protein n=1 Tax=Posidoniimonas polymericola TaxID=2528002 RepID=UPI0018D3AC1A|nr:RDD family protein [Posidoniimonas polymericola]